MRIKSSIHEATKKHMSVEFFDFLKKIIKNGYLLRF